MLRLLLHCLCLGTLISSNLVNSTITEDEEPRRTYPARRAIDGTRGSKYYVADSLDDGQFDSFGSSAGQYDPFEEETDFSDIRNNIPGEPGVDYPSYTRLPQTGFLCENEFRGYYADEAAGCQVFHVCDGTFLVSSFLCPIGSIFSQKLLTCDWWSKVDCSATRNYHVINSQSLVSEADDDEILRKAFEMASVQSAGERIPAETINAQQQQEQQRRPENRRNRVLNYGINAVTQRGINDLQSGPDNYSDYPDYPSRGVASRHRTSGQQLPNRQRYQSDDYYSQNVEEDDSPKRNDNPKVRVHTIGEDRKNDRQDSFRNEFRPSYAPTVPTVTTTSRSFYSPTIPTTSRPSTVFRDPSRYDLEVESSDHLYTARGRSDETIRAATPPSVILKDVVAAKSGPSTLVSSAVEEKEEINENIEESESTDRKTLTLPEFATNLKKIEASPEEIVATSDCAPENITETLTILSIDDEDVDPAVFSYSRDEEETKIVSSSIPESRINSTEDTNLRGNSGDKTPAEFLQPPQKEDKSQFRITVLEETSSNTPKSVEETQRRGKSLKINSTSVVNAIIEVPTSHVTRPVLENENEIRESRIIRIFVNNNETVSSNSSGSIASQNSTDIDAKIHEIDAAIHKIDAEILNRENYAATIKIDEDFVNKTEEAVTVEEAESVKDAITVEDTESVKDAITVEDAESVKDAITVENAESVKDALTFKEAQSVKDYQPVEEAQSVKDAATFEETASVKDALTVEETQSVKDSVTVEEAQSIKDAVTVEEAQTIKDAVTVEEAQTIKDAVNVEEAVTVKNAVTVEEPSATTTSVPSNGTKPNAIPTFDNLRSIDINNLAAFVAANEEIVSNDPTTLSSIEKISSLSEEKEIEDHERPSRSEVIEAKEEIIADSVNEASSPFQVTLTVNTNEELDPNGEAIRKLIAQQEIGDSIGSGDYKNFEIVKSQEPGTLNDEPEEPNTSSDAVTNLKNERRINEREGKNIGDEKLNNFHTNSLQTMDYYRNIVALVNGPNVPRPFSLKSQQNVGNVEIKTPSDLSDGDASTSSPFVTGTSRNEVVTATMRAPSQSTRQPIASSSQEPERLEKLSSNTKVLDDQVILEQSSQNFGERKTGKQKLIFELPHSQRSLDFVTGFPLQNRERESVSLDDRDRDTVNSKVTEKSTDKSYDKTVVETEVIPSLGFSLNTAEEREEYMEAVAKGLLPDVRATETTKNNTETSAER